MKKNVQSVITVLAVATLVVSTSCKKDKKTTTPPAAEVTQQDIIVGLSSNVNAATYTQLSANSSDLYTAILAFTANPSAAGLTECKNLWKSARSTWEQSEGFLYGPVASEDIDPRIDTWPVNFVDLNAEIAGTAQFTDTYIDGLEHALKGFHPIEFLLWGENGTKTFDQFTAREKEYLVALGKNLKTLTAQLAVQWNTNTTDAYIKHFTSPGASNQYYATSKAVYQEIVNAMAGICDEVSSGKIGEPFLAADPSLEESPYSQNSLKDFTDNMRSVQNVYLGKFNADGNGLEDLVKKYNLSLDTKIKTKISGAITALNNITVPFGTAITTQPTQVQNAINAIADLKAVLENELLPFVNQYVAN